MSDTISCSHCLSLFSVTKDDRDFYNKVAPKIWVKVFTIPDPTLCPSCRQRRRLSFRNERKLYRRQCDASKKDIISMYSPDKWYKVYDPKVRRSDARSGLDYWRNFDYSKKFMEQFDILMKDVPHLSLLWVQNEGSDYVNWVFAWVRCYLSFNCDYIEDSLYLQNSIQVKNSIDCLSCMNSQYLYQCIMCDNCYECFFSTSCVDCSHCYQCSDLVGKQYHIRNVAYSKEEYYKILSDISTWFYNPTIKDIHAYKNSWSHHILDCQNLENCTYCYYVYDSKDCMDFDIFWDNSSLIYESIAIWPNCRKNLFSSCLRWKCSNCFYSFLSIGCSDIFWCAWLRNAQYCIFNKQYTKETYEIEVAKIIWHMMETLEWWEFFDLSLSPFGYNETVAQEYFPATQQEISHLWYKRSKYEPPQPNIENTIDISSLPTDIALVLDDVVNNIFRCVVSNKPYRITPQELAFYKKHNISLPNKHPDVRHQERMRLKLHKKN